MADASNLPSAANGGFRASLAMANQQAASLINASGDSESRNAGTLLNIVNKLKQSRVDAANVVEVYLKPPWWCQAVVNETGTLAGRAGFLAGFAYYEFSRQSEENTQRVPYYAVLL